MWLILSYVILLAEHQGSLGLLIAWMNLHDGVELSSFSVFFPFDEPCQCLVHVIFVDSLCLCFMVDVLIASGQCRMWGSWVLSDVCPIAASFTPLFTSLFS